MNGFLVIGRCGMDDVPMRLCASRKEALDYAHTVTQNDVRSQAEECNNVTVTDVIALVVVPFRDGLPGRMIAVENGWY